VVGGIDTAGIPMSTLRKRNMTEKDWRSDEDRENDLRLENQSLESEIVLQSGCTFESKNIDPELKNAFLKRVLAYEEADKEPCHPILSLFPKGYTFPLIEEMSPGELMNKLDEIASILSMHNIEFGFANDLPVKVLYRYLVEEYLPNEMFGGVEEAGFTRVIDGCDGACEGCFQREYCSTAQEILEQDNKES
jgi:hypothetical protein